MSQITKSKTYLDFCEDTIKIKDKVEVVFLEIGMRLHEISKHKMWSGRWEDFDHFCREGLKMDRSSAFKIMAIYRTFVLDYDIEIEKLARAGGWTRLSMILPHVENKETAEEWIHEAIHAQSKSDLKKIIHEKNTGIDPIKCRHSETDKYTVITCKRCGESWRDYGDKIKK